MLENVIPLFPGIPGGPEVLIVLFVLVLLFGANKIPKLARSTGQAMGEFQKGRQELEEELEQGSEGTDTGGAPAERSTEATNAGTAPSEAADSGTEADGTTAAADEDAERETTNN